MRGGYRICLSTSTKSKDNPVDDRVWKASEKMEMIYLLTLLLVLRSRYSTMIQKQRLETHEDLKSVILNWFKF